MPQPSKHRPFCKHTNSYKVVQARMAEESQESERAEGTYECILGKVPFAQGLEECVSLQLLLIEEESRVDFGKGERKGADDKEGPE